MQTYVDRMRVGVVGWGHEMVVIARVAEHGEECRGPRARVRGFGTVTSTEAIDPAFGALASGPLVVASNRGGAADLACAADAMPTMARTVRSSTIQPVRTTDEPFDALLAPYRGEGHAVGRSERQTGAFR
ncbi:MAG: hypothetical protein EOP67_36500 [Sphingomonas sp.]|nr:MAG: hypothetical protein EOP67_36500 [Sphingomonas sp.]